jgi:hypothetical protein
MNNQILILLTGGLIAIISGAITQIVNSVIERKNQKNKLAFEKIEDIITSASMLEEGMQEDAAFAFRIRDTNSPTPNINLSFEQIKLECLIKIFHKDLAIPFDDVKRSLRNYNNTKLEILNASRTGILNTQLEEELFLKLSKDYEAFGEASKSFILGLTKYGQSIIK